MTNKILYIYGYGSNPETSSTMNALKGIITELGFELVSIWYDQKKPFESVEFLENYVKSNNIKYIVGHSLGGFYALCIDADVRKIVINPCLKPHIELQKLDDFDPEIDIKAYEKCYEQHIRKDLFSAFDIMGLFGTHDELLCYYSDFKELSPYAYFFPATHRPSKESFESIKTTIAEFLGGEPLKNALTEMLKNSDEFIDRGDYIELAEPVKLDSGKTIHAIEKYGSPVKLDVCDAFRYADKLNIEKMGGFEDWHVPSPEELKYLRSVQDKCGINFKGDCYMSSKFMFMIGWLHLILGNPEKRHESRLNRGYYYVICVR